MKISFAIGLAALLTLATIQTASAQAPALAKAQGLWAEQVQAAAKKTEQAKEPVQQALYMPQEGESSGVAQVGHPSAYPANCPPGGFGWGGHAGYGHHGHPGHLMNGGRYGYFGGAHRTPGYPHHHFNREYVGPQGPPTAQVAYPYYTIRGPRDFLLDNPPSIGR